ncbi:hypothetical protein Tco_1467549 [Tanacetum coccineum]
MSRGYTGLVSLLADAQDSRSRISQRSYELARSTYFMGDRMTLQRPMAVEEEAMLPVTPTQLTAAEYSHSDTAPGGMVQMRTNKVQRHSHDLGITQEKDDGQVLSAGEIKKARDEFAEL